MEARRIVARRVFVPCLMAVALSAIAFEPPNQVPALSIEDMPIACAGEGAIWIHRSEKFVCASDSTEDAGRSCREQSDCDGACVASDAVQPNTPVVGRCSDRYVPDCARYVSSGVAGPEICR